jgi:hypothetical protein
MDCFATLAMTGVLWWLGGGGGIYKNKARYVSRRGGFQTRPYGGVIASRKAAGNPEAAVDCFAALAMTGVL